MENTAAFRGEVALRLGQAEVWDLMWRRRGQAQWLGPAARVDFDPAVRSVLADEAGVWRMARTVKVKASKSLTMQIEMAESWGAGVATQLTIGLSVDAERGTVVAIEETSIPCARGEEVKQFWTRRLDRLAEMASRVRARRRNVRQAVVVIHGIGEQQPGETLSSLVKSGVLSAEDGHQDQWVKPDRFSDSYELRRITLKASEQRPTTEVFEFYWAHIIGDTTLAQVAAWLQRLLFRWPVPRPLLTGWSLAWVVAVVALGATLASMTGVEFASKIAYGTLLTGLAVAFWRFVATPLAVNFIGDAARYLRPHPTNIAHRQAIRQAGVALLDKLHASGRYDRIVILGHSLGSVIAYDIVTHAWIGMHGAHRSPSKPSFAEIKAVEKALHDGTVANVQDLQHAAWRRLRANTQPWLVTDLVTVGSPLTYADFLIASDAAGFERAKADRVLPTCPPITELEARTQHNRMTYDASYAEPLSSGERTFVQFHHAAPFAVTRWTNLFFTTRYLGFVGDLIGGPLRGQLGAWIQDVPLRSPGNRFTHTWYWRILERDRAHLDALRAALRLDLRVPLLELLNEIPAFSLIGDED